MKKHNNLKIGAINWDAFFSGDSYFGGFAMNSLANKKHCHRLPFFIKNTDNGYIVPCRTLEEYEVELKFAIDAGLDFFAYCWYPDGDKQNRDIWQDNETFAFLSDHYHELNYSRKLYQQSPLNKKIGMCAILFCINAYSKEDFDSLFDAMEQDYYVKVDGKPLVLIFDKYDAGFIDCVRGYALKRNIELYVAFVNNDGCLDKNGDYGKADAVTAYAACRPSDSFDELTKKVRVDNNNRAEYGVSVIPLLSLGWNPSPRVDNPVPWCGYEDKTYAEKIDEKGIDDAFADLIDFENSTENATTGLALVFAWNEFEEGGYLCPTLKNDGTSDDSLVKYFVKAKNKYIGN